MERCPLQCKNVYEHDCNNCKVCGCRKILVAVLDACKNVEETMLLDKKIEQALSGREAVIVSNKWHDCAAEAIASRHNFEFIYSWACDSDFGSIPEMVAEHSYSVAVLTDKEDAKRFASEVNKYQKKGKTTIKIWNLSVV